VVGGPLGRESSEFFFVIHEPLKGFEEFTKGWSGKHDGVAATADIFGYLEKTPPLVFLQVQEKHFPLVGDFF